MWGVGDTDSLTVQGSSVYININPYICIIYMCTQFNTEFKHDLMS